MKPLAPDPLTVSTSRAVSCRAWLGYRSARPLTVAVCAWHPGGTVALEEWARTHETVVSHGCCTVCAARMRFEAGLEADLVAEAETAFANVHRPLVDPVQKILMDRACRPVLTTTTSEDKT